VDHATHHANMAMRELAIVSGIEQMVAGVRNRVAPYDWPNGEAEAAGAAVGVGARGAGMGRAEPLDAFPAGAGAGGAGLLQQDGAAEAALLLQAEQLEECLDYVLHREAGSSDLVFGNGDIMRDCDTEGNRLPSRETVDPDTGVKRGMLFDDFVSHPSARLAGLRREHVLALRLYTTIAYMSINNPLRDEGRQTAGRAHPLPVTVALLEKAVLQLRKVEGNAATAHESVDLFRGLAGSTIQPEFMATVLNPRTPNP